MPHANLLILLGAFVGHLALTTTILNVAYGQGWIARPFLKCVRTTHDLWIVAGTPWLAWQCYMSDLFWTGLWSFPPDALRLYILLSAMIGWLIVPLAMVTRKIRRIPSVQISNHGRTIDVAAELGRRPVGRGPDRLAAYWPWNEQFQIEILERTYLFPKLPAALEGLSILHISDLHFMGTISFEYFERVIDESTRLDCDLVAFTGDLVDMPGCYDWVPELMGRLRSRLGCYAILGNHDFWFDHARIRRDLAGIGFRSLAGRWEVLKVKGHPLVIAGTEAPWMGRLPDLSAAPPGAFRVLLSHTPDNAPWASRQPFDLMLAGHNHGGQVRLPLIGPVFMPSRYGCKFDMGTFQVGPTVVHVSRGVSGRHPYRFRCRPEVTKLVLLKGQA